MNKLTSTRKDVFMKRVKIEAIVTLEEDGEIRPNHLVNELCKCISAGRIELNSSVYDITIMKFNNIDILDSELAELKQKRGKLESLKREINPRSFKVVSAFGSKNNERVTDTYPSLKAILDENDCCMITTINELDNIINLCLHDFNTMRSTSVTFEPTDLVVINNTTFDRTILIKDHYID